MHGLYTPLHKDEKRKHTMWAYSMLHEYCENECVMIVVVAYNLDQAQRMMLNQTSCDLVEVQGLLNDAVITSCDMTQPRLFMRLTTDVGGATISSRPEDYA
jgi:hypothetical protein